MKYIRHIVLDEADVLLDKTFVDKLCHFLDNIPVLKLFLIFNNFKHSVLKYTLNVNLIIIPLLILSELQ
jgi:superfamily II DNA/RNA helicase